MAQKLNKPPDVYGYMIVGKADPALREYSDLLWALRRGLPGERPRTLAAGLEPGRRRPGAAVVVRPGLHHRRWRRQACAAYGWEENSQLFASGQAAMNKDWGPSGFKDPKASKIIDTFGVARPAGRTEIRQNDRRVPRTRPSTSSPRTRTRPGNSSSG